MEQNITIQFSSATNTVGESELSTEVNATPVNSTIPPAPPEDVSAVSGDAKVTLSWSPSVGATSIQHLLEHKQHL